MMIAHEDSVSAGETRRLRERDAALRALRDSLRNAPVARRMRDAVAPTATMATMQAQIHFAFDKSALTDSAKTILDDKVAVFRANPTMTIVMLGYTDVEGHRRVQHGARRRGAPRRRRRTSSRKASTQTA